MIGFGIDSLRAGFFSSTAELATIGQFSNYPMRLIDKQHLPGWVNSQRNTMSRPQLCVAILAMLLSCFSYADESSPGQERYATSDECLSAIEKHSKQEISKILWDNPKRVSGFLANGKAFGCILRQSDSHGIYWVGWFDIVSEKSEQMNIVNTDEYERIPLRRPASAQCQQYLVKFDVNRGIVRYTITEICSNSVDLFFENEGICSTNEIRMLTVGERLNAMRPQPVVVQKWMKVRGGEVREALDFVCEKVKAEEM